jgi:hypothetical protein
MPTVVKPLAGLCISAYLCFAAAELKITAPSDGTVVHPGDIVNVSVWASIDTFAAIIILGVDPIGASDGLRTSPPYNFTVHIPRKITPGAYGLTASGTTKAGKVLSSGRINLDVEEPDEPLGFRVDPEGPFELRLGQTVGLNVIATFRNGVGQFLTNSKRTKFISADPHVVTVTDDGLVTCVGEGSTEVRVSIGDKVTVIRIVVTKREEK